MVNQTVVTKNGYFLMTNDLVIVNQTQEEKTTSS